MHLLKMARDPEGLRVTYGWKSTAAGHLPRPAVLSISAGMRFLAETPRQCDSPALDS